MDLYPNVSVKRARYFDPEVSQYQQQPLKIEYYRESAQGTNSLSNNLAEAATVAVDKQKYQGQLNEKGERHGFGTLVGTYYNKGNIYTGQFRNNEKHGQGTYYYKDGKRYGNSYSGGTYTGSFENDKRHGKGMMKFNNGDIYNGDWKFNKLCGHGIMHYGDGSIYEGMWKDNKKHGEGVLTDKYSRRFEGPWVKGGMIM